MRTKLEAHLSSLKRERAVMSWHDRKIMPGDNWNNRINEQINKADVILLLISADFLASDYCSDIELKRALQRDEAGEAIVIPIILRPCDWTSSRIGQLQALPRNGKPVSSYPTQDHAFSEVVRGIRRLIDDLIKSKTSYTKKGNTEAHSVKARRTSEGNKEFQCGGIQMSIQTREQLERMRIINALIKTDEEVLFDDEVVGEYREIQEEMVHLFTPVVKLLVKAGLLTVNINLEDIESLEEYSTLNGDPTFVFDNGNIWIDAEHSGGMLRKKG